MWTFFVNGERVTVDPARWGPETTLLEYLRRGPMALTGAKLGCGEGGCGACTVMVSSVGVSSGELVHRSVNACLAPLCSVESMLVTTVEGIGSERSSAPHPVQERVAKFHGSQCGFCTPGIVMSLYTALRNESRPTMAALEEAFDGNLCRCTGYRPIIDAARSFATDRASCPCSREPRGGAGVTSEAAAAAIAGDGDQGPSVDLRGGKVVVSSSRTKAVATLGSALGAPEGTIERCSQVFDPDAAAPPFPDELARGSAVHLRVAGAQATWERPTSELALLRILAAEPSARIVAGNTEVGIETKFKHVACPFMVSTGAIASMHVLACDAACITIGGAVTLASLEHFLHAEIASTMVRVTRRPTYGTTAAAAAAGAEDGGDLEPHFSMRGAVAMCNMLRWFASTQIRNVATLAGNIATASPISDMNPVLVALNADVVLASIDSNGDATERLVSMHDFFLGYRKTAIAPHEVILRIIVPLTTRFEFVQSYKQARRRDDDISITTACMRVGLEVAPPARDVDGSSRASGASSAWRVHSASLAFGGMGPTTFTATAAEDALTGQIWSRDLWSVACAALQRSVALPPSVVGGMAAFRTTLAVSFMYKFCIATNIGLATAHDSARIECELLGLLAHARGDPAALAVPAAVPLAARECVANFFCMHTLLLLIYSFVCSSTAAG